MQVIATAGHVDHGKSALLRALTGMEPDRWAEEQRRGMTIDLGYAWMRLPSGQQLAFVDVPGHARFVPNMLAGVGPVPAVLFVVAADGGWMPQSAEHLAAIDALGISRGLIAVTRADLADPGPALAQATAMIRRSSLGDAPAVAVSAVTGAGLADLTAALDRLAAGLPDPDPAGAVRIWVDRAFSITGSGTVVTGTLPGGTIRRGDELLVTPAQRPVRIRGLQSLGSDAAELSGVTRAALNLRGVGRAELARGMALVQPGRWTLTQLIDVRVAAGRLPRLVTLHIGSARSPARVRPLGDGLARLSLREPVPLHVGDRVLLRDPGAARTHGSAAGPDLELQPTPSSGPTPRTGPAVSTDAASTSGADPDSAGWPGVFGAIVLDVAPPPLTRRRAAAAAAAELASWPDRPAADDLLRRHRLLRSRDLLAMGVAEHPSPVAGDWLADPGYWADLGRQLATIVAEHRAREPLAPGMTIDAARAALGLPDRRLVQSLVTTVSEPRTAASAPRTAVPAVLATDPAQPALRIIDGLIVPVAGAGGSTLGLPAGLTAAVATLRAELAARPFHAPEAGRLRELGLDSRSVATAARHGELLRLADQIVLAPGADQQAARILARLDQPFTAAAAKTALDSTRRTVIPLLEHLDRTQITRRLPDDRRTLR
jgi:selenocysteine-specific elongation factor